MRLILVFAVLFVLVMAAGRDPVEAQNDEILPGCNLPKSYGRLVTLTNPPNGGLAGQAVFEDGTGTIRFVAFIYSVEFQVLPKATRLREPFFPALPLYECKIGAVWQRH